MEGGCEKVFHDDFRCFSEVVLSVLFRAPKSRPPGPEVSFIKDN